MFEDLGFGVCLELSRLAVFSLLCSCVGAGLTSTRLRVVVSAALRNSECAMPTRQLRTTDRGHDTYDHDRDPSEMGYLLTRSEEALLAAWIFNPRTCVPNPKDLNHDLSYLKSVYDPSFQRES